MDKKYITVYTLTGLLLLFLLTQAEGQLIPSRIERPYYGYNTPLTSPRAEDEGTTAIDSRRTGMDINLGVIESYDDNIRLRSKDKIDDTSTTIEPSIRLLWPHRTSSLSLRYFSNLLFYNQHSTDNRYTHIGEGAAEFYLASNVALNLWVHDVYTLFPRDLRLADTTRRNAIEGNVFEMRPSLRFEHMRPVYLEGGYLYQRQDYVKEEQGVEWKRVGPNFNIGREITPRWDVALQYQYYEKDYQRNPRIISSATDYNDNIAGLRLRYKPYGNLSSEIIYNRLWRNFQTREDVQESLWQGIITYTVSADVTLRANYQQTFLDDINGNLFRHDVAEFRVEHRISRIVMARYGLFAYKDAYEFSPRKYESFGTNDSVAISILQRLSLLLQVNYERRRFQNSEDDRTIEHYYTLGAELDYFIEGRFMAFVRYLRLENIADSDESAAGDYASNRYALGLRFMF